MEKRWEEVYRQKIGEQGAQVGALLVPSLARLQLPYKAMLRNLSTAGTSLLDVGCGFANLPVFLREQGQEPATYVGIEAIDTFAAQAKKAYPSGEVIVGDVETMPVTRQFDVVCGFGLMATVQDFRPLLANLLKWSSGWVIFDCLSAKVYKGRFKPYEPAEVLEHVLGITPYVWLSHDPTEQFFVTGVNLKR